MDVKTVVNLTAKETGDAVIAAARSAAGVGAGGAKVRITADDEGEVGGAVVEFTGVTKHKTAGA